MKNHDTKTLILIQNEFDIACLGDRTAEHSTIHMYLQQDVMIPVDRVAKTWNIEDGKSKLYVSNLFSHPKEYCFQNIWS